MKQLLELDTTKIISTWKEAGKFTLTHPYKNKKNAFLMHMLSLFSTIDVVKNTNWNAGKVSMAKTIAAIPEFHKTPEGMFPRSKIIELLWIAAYVPRGKLLSISQTKAPKYGALTPLFMYAQKRDNDVSYADWDYDDAKINAALGEFLATANNFRKAYPLMVFEDNSTLRRSLAREKKYTEWNPYCKYPIDLDPVDGEDEGESLIVPKEVSIMANQFWIANVESRDTSTMLLNLWSPGFVPKALDAAIPRNERSLEDEL